MGWKIDLMLDAIQFDAVELPLHQCQLFLVAGVADVFGVLKRSNFLNGFTQQLVTFCQSFASEFSPL